MGRSVKAVQSKQGQALILAVMIMLAILLMGTLFIAVVNYSQRSSGRHAQLLKAMTLAEAGIEYANKMLQFSPDGLDWRPPTPPFQYDDGSPGPLFWGLDDTPYTNDDYYSDQEILNGWYAVVMDPDGNPNTGDEYHIRNGFSSYPEMTGGHFLLRVTYDPDPPYEPWQEDDPDPIADPLSRHIKIESIGVADTGGFVFRKLQAYKPTVLTDYLLFVSDQTEDGATTSLGFDPLIDMNNDLDLTDPEDFFSPEYPGSLITYTYNGPIRSNTHLVFYGANRGGAAGTPADASNRIVLASEPLAAITGQVFSIPLWGGYCRDDFIESSGLVTDEQFASVGEFGVGLQLVTAGGPFWHHLDPDTVKDGIARLNAPDLFAEDPATGTMRWDPLSRQSGEVVTAIPPSPLIGAHNTGEFGHGRGIYVDNTDDLQFLAAGPARIDWLIQDWLHNLAPGTTDSGWNELGEVYDQAPAVRIELFPDEDAVLEWAREAGHLEGADLPITDLSGAIPSYPSGKTRLWWPGHNNATDEPGIMLIRDDDDEEWRFGDPSQPGELGTLTGTFVMCRDYPNADIGEYPVIFAEGNVRIKGRLPRADDGPTGYPGRYNLTVVSRGTIYVDGQILSPQDQWGRQVTGDSIAAGLVSDQDNTYIGLLARDCVVVNPTMLVPQDNADGAIQEPDDPANPTGPDQHWQLPENQPGANVSGGWYFGHTATTIANNHEIRLVAYQRMDATAGTFLELPCLAGAASIQVEDASSFHDGYAVMVTPINGQGEYPPEDAVFLGTVTGEPVGKVIQLLDPPGASDAFSAGAFVETTTPALATTGVNLEVYDSSTDTWNYYDFDRSGLPADATDIFWLTRQDLADQPDIWEVNSPWCPLQKPNPLDSTDIWWPWLLYDGTTDYLGLGRAGLLNYARLKMPDLTAIPNAQDYWLKKFKLQEFDGTDPVGTIHAKVNALMYAQEGCFFVIPCRYFKEDVSVGEAREYLRYNYDIEIRGAITENFHPDQAAVREWQEKWAWPYVDPSDVFHWNSIRYIFDETLLAAREQAVTDLVVSRRYAPIGSMQLDLVKVPLLPASADLLYYGEAQ